MSKNADRRLVSDVEITMIGDQVVESRLETLNPEAVANYQEFLKRLGGSRAPHIVEHIEIATVA
jgi:hypothetical protein